MNAEEYAKVVGDHGKAKHGGKLPQMEFRNVQKDPKTGAMISYEVICKEHKELLAKGPITPAAHPLAKAGFAKAAAPAPKAAAPAPKVAAPAPKAAAPPPAPKAAAPAPVAKPAAPPPAPKK